MIQGSKLTCLVFGIQNHQKTLVSLDLDLLHAILPGTWNRMCHFSSFFYPFLRSPRFSALRDASRSEVASTAPFGCFKKLGVGQGSNPRRAMARPGCLLQLCSCSFMFVSLGCQKARTPQQGNHSLRCRPGMSSSSVNRRASHWSNGIVIPAAMLFSAEKYTRFSAQMLEPNQQEFWQGIKLVLVLMLLPPDMICNASSLSRNAASTQNQRAAAASWSGSYPEVLSTQALPTSTDAQDLK